MTRILDASREIYYGDDATSAFLDEKWKFLIDQVCPGGIDFCVHLVHHLSKLTRSFTIHGERVLL